MVQTRKINLNALRIAESAARLGSFTRASEEQLITPSAVSQRISRLEDELQFKIFHRKGNIINLTYEGDELIGMIKEALDTIDTAGIKISDSNHKSIVKLSIPRPLAIRWFLPRLAGFQERHPDIFLSVSTSHQASGFAEADCDCAIRYGNGKFRNLHKTFLFNQRLTPVCSPEVLDQMLQAAKARKPKPADLGSCTMLHSNKANADWEIWLEHEKSLKVAESASHAYFDSEELVIEAALSGAGFAMVELSDVADLIKEGKLLSPFAKKREQPLGWHFLRPKKATASSKLLLFESWIGEEAARYRDFKSSQHRENSTSN